jgi:hypothetical protein
MPVIPDLLEHFESLGPDGEFAMLQSIMGLTPVGLFARSTVPVADLLQALEQDFAGIDDAARHTLSLAADGEYVLGISDTCFACRTGKFEHEIDAARVLAQMKILTGFLVRKLRADLAAGAKLFVRLGGSRDDAGKLAAALRRAGPNTLLWVTQAMPKDPLGAVTVLEDGLLRGTLDRFAPRSDPRAVSALWYELCVNACAAWRAACLPGTVVVRPAGAASHNLIPRRDSYDAPEWTSGALADTESSDAEPPVKGDDQVMRHMLHSGTGDSVETLRAVHVDGAMTPGEIHCGSMYVWVGPEFTGDVVAPVFLGCPSVSLQGADLAARGKWQRIFVTTRIPAGYRNAKMALQLRGPAGSVVYSTAWQIERGGRPGGYVRVG